MNDENQRLYDSVASMPEPIFREAALRALKRTLEQGERWEDLAARAVAQSVELHNDLKKLSDAWPAERAGVFVLVSIVEFVVILYLILRLIA